MCSGPGYGAPASVAFSHRVAASIRLGSFVVQGINQDTLFLSVGGMFLSLAGAVVSGFLIRSAWVRPGLIPWGTLNHLFLPLVISVTFG